MLDLLSESASVEAVYGEPIEINDRTIVPVARVAYGFGASDEESDNGEVGSGGRGTSVTPLGVVEVTEETNWFDRFDDWKRLGLAAVCGLLFGALLARRKSRRSADHAFDVGGPGPSNDRPNHIVDPH